MDTTLISYISIDPNIRFGKPCIKGTRITVSDILSWLSYGMTHQKIMEDYPTIEDIHIKATLNFAANRETFIKILTAA